MKPRSSLPSLVLNVPALARRSAGDVQALLGPPDTPDAPGAPAQIKRTYQRGRVEVVYLQDVAQWIKLNDCRGLSFGPEALPKLGLPSVRPSYRNPEHVMSWKNIPRLQEVSLYAGSGGSVSSVLVCVETAQRAPTATRAPARGRSRV